MQKTNLFAVTYAADYANQAEKEIREIEPGLKIREILDTGIMIVEPAQSAELFNKAVINKKLVFVRHINAVQYVLDFEEAFEKDGLTQIIKEYINYIDKEDKVAVQVRRGKCEITATNFEVKSHVDELLNNIIGIQTVVKDADKIISVLLHNGNLYIGLSKAEYNLSNWTGGMVHYKKDDKLDISRAKFKLMEAIEVFDISLSGVKKALDLGAAPGGFTSVLLEHGIEVTAVDTGEMDKRLNKYPNYRFIKQNASEIELEENSFDFLTSDISWNPINTAKIVKRAAAFLKPEGRAVVTVKLMSDKIWKTINRVIEIYDEEFEILGAKQLFHNRDEITLYMKKR